MRLVKKCIKTSILFRPPSSLYSFSPHKIYCEELKVMGGYAAAQLLKIRRLFIIRDAVRMRLLIRDKKDIESPSSSCGLVKCSKMGKKSFSFSTSAPNRDKKSNQNWRRTQPGYTFESSTLAESSVVFYKSSCEVVKRDKMTCTHVSCVTLCLHLS